MCVSQIALTCAYIKPLLSFKSALKRWRFSRCKNWLSLWNALKH